MPRPLSEYTRGLVDGQLSCGMSIPSIHEDTGVSIRQIRKMRSNQRIWGSSKAPILRKNGRPRALTSEMEEALAEYLEERPWAYRDEMGWFLWDEFEVDVSPRTLSNALKRMGHTRKTLQRKATQQDHELRAEWLVRLANWTADQLVFVDESAANERNKNRKFGWAHRGVRASTSTPLKRSERWSVLPAYTVKGYMAWTVRQGSITGVLFNSFIQNHVLPQCSPFPGPNSVLIMDNASIHCSEELADMCTEAGVQLVFLPPYSPDYNPIEQSFATLKQWMQRHGELAEEYKDDFEGYVRLAVEEYNRGRQPGAHFRSAYIGTALTVTDNGYEF